MTPPFRADLHSHSSCSDGSLSPQELIAKAAEKGLQALSITDHDTVEAYRTALPAAAAAGIALISGVEFSTIHMGHSIHLLAYSFTLDSPAIAALCIRHRERRKKRNEEIMERLKKKGLTISEDDLLEETAPGTMIGRPHIAAALVRKGYVADIREAFQRYISDTAPCFVQGEVISTEETIAGVHEAKGYAVLAHPHLIDPSSLVYSLLKLPLDGIEVYYGTFSHEKNRRWLALSQRHHLFATGGSDFHGAMKPNVALGCSWAPQETFELLHNRFLANHDR